MKNLLSLSALLVATAALSARADDTCALWSDAAVPVIADANDVVGPWQSVSFKGAPENLALYRPHFNRACIGKPGFAAVADRDHYHMSIPLFVLTKAKDPVADGGTVTNYYTSAASTQYRLYVRFKKRNDSDRAVRSGEKDFKMAIKTVCDDADACVQGPSDGGVGALRLTGFLDFAGVDAKGTPKPHLSVLASVTPPDRLPEQPALTAKEDPGFEQALKAIVPEDANGSVDERTAVQVERAVIRLIATDEVKAKLESDILGGDATALAVDVALLRGQALDAAQQAFLGDDAELRAALRAQFDTRAQAAYACRGVLDESSGGSDALGQADTMGTRSRNAAAAPTSEGAAAAARTESSPERLRSACASVLRPSAAAVADGAPGGPPAAAAPAPGAPSLSGAVFPGTRNDPPPTGRVAASGDEDSSSGSKDDSVSKGALGGAVGGGAALVAGAALGLGGPLLLGLFVVAVAIGVMVALGNKGTKDSGS